MLARIRKAMEEKDQGFTLIELLVVMIIIGILAAIAIPVFLNQRKKAVDSSIKSDLRTVATEMETYFTDNQAYIVPTFTAGTSPTETFGVGGDVAHLSNNNVFSVVLYDSTGAATATAASAVAYCVQGYNLKATADSATNA